MTFADLERLSDRLHLTDALNLDGGGSTTMVVRGHVVNRPSDPAGARPVSDALVVLASEPSGAQVPEPSPHPTPQAVSPKP